MRSWLSTSISLTAVASEFLTTKVNGPLSYDACSGGQPFAVRATLTCRLEEDPPTAEDAGVDDFDDDDDDDDDEQATRVAVTAATAAMAVPTRATRVRERSRS